MLPIEDDGHGLAVVYGRVWQMGGSIGLRSKRNSATGFDIHLPRP